MMIKKNDDEKGAHDSQIVKTHNASAKKATGGTKLASLTNLSKEIYVGWESLLYLTCLSHFFHILVLQEYWVLMENRIPLKLVLGSLRTVALSISSHV